MIKRTAHRIFQIFGYDFASIKHFKKGSKSPKLIERINNIEKLGFKPDLIIDGGAHKGNWTKSIAQIYPNANYILVEPNPLVNKFIKENLNETPNLEYEIIAKALGSKNEMAKLNVWPDTDNIMVGSSLCGHIKGEAEQKIDCEIVSVDSLTSIYQQVPDLIKLDLQGYEREALEGSTECLKKTEIFIIEFSCLDAYLNRTNPRQIIDIMYDNSYCLYDIIDLHYRPYDNALTGGDFIFVKNNSVLKNHKDWK